MQNFRPKQRIARKKYGHSKMYAVGLQGLEHLWDNENMFETGAVRASEG